MFRGQGEWTLLPMQWLCPLIRCWEGVHAYMYIFSPVWPEKEPAFSHLHIVSGTASSYLSELLHLFSLSCSLCSEGILGSSVFIGWAEGPWGRDPFNTSDLWSGTLFLSLSGICLHSLKSKLKTHHFSPAYCSVVFFSLYQPKVQHNLLAVFFSLYQPKVQHNLLAVFFSLYQPKVQRNLLAVFFSLYQPKVQHNLLAVFFSLYQPKVQHNLLAVFFSLYQPKVQHNLLAVFFSLDGGCLTQRSRRTHHQ